MTLAALLIVFGLKPLAYLVALILEVVSESFTFINNQFQ